MPVETRWMIEKRICYQRIFGEVALKEVTQAVEAAALYAADGRPPVYFIVDVTELQSYPPLASVLRVMPHTSPPNVNCSVLVVHHPLLRFMGTLLTQLSGMRYHTVVTVHEALQFLYRRDSTLPTNTQIRGGDAALSSGENSTQ